MRPLRAGDDYDRAVANLARWTIENAADVIARFPADAALLPFGIDEERHTVYAVASAGDQPEFHVFEAKLSEELWSDEAFFLSRRAAVGVSPGGSGTLTMSPIIAAAEAPT